MFMLLSIFDRNILLGYQSKYVFKIFDASGLLVIGLITHSIVLIKADICCANICYIELLRSLYDGFWLRCRPGDRREAEYRV
jgi:hypothetical protein